MCTIWTWTRKPHIMDASTYNLILRKFVPYVDSLQFLSLFLCGEPLLDKGLGYKIMLAKSLGFKGIGIASNCTELSDKTSKILLCSGLDTLVCSVDGIKKETHEGIRVGVNFDKVVANILNFLEARKTFGKTKVIVRFVRQKANEGEWEEFREWWSKRINPEYGDMVYAYNVTNCNDDCKDFDDKDPSGKDVPTYCDQLDTRMIVFSRGEVPLCCADNNDKFKIGNVLETDPIELYNGEFFSRYRDMIKSGRIRELDLCGTCTVPRSQKEMREELWEK